jgi:hypothetical protein
VKTCTGATKMTLAVLLAYVGPKYMVSVQYDMYLLMNKHVYAMIIGCSDSDLPRDVGG